MDLRDQQDNLTQLVSDILDEARRQGADQAEVSASVDAGLAVSVRKGDVEQVEFNQDRGFGITLYFGQRKGSASTSDSNASAIADTVAAAKNIARYTEEDDCSGLAAAELMATEFEDLDLFHPWAVDAEQATEMAVACEAAGLSLDARVARSDGAQVTSHQAVRVYGNSHGFMGVSNGTRQGMSRVLIGEDEQGMQRDYWYTVARKHEDLDAPAQVGEKAAERTVQRLSPRKAPTGKFPVLFDATLSGGLVGHLLGAISGGALYRKASFLTDSLGTQILPPDMSLVERPRLRGQLGSTCYDADGVATYEQAFVKEGVIASYILSEYSARKLGMQTTANSGGVFNLDVDGQSKPVAQLLAEMNTGLYVTELMGQGVNGVTGDYSRGTCPSDCRR